MPSRSSGNGGEETKKILIEFGKGQPLEDLVKPLENLQG